MDSDMPAVVTRPVAVLRHDRLASVSISGEDNVNRRVLVGSVVAEITINRIESVS